MIRKLFALIFILLFCNGSCFGKSESLSAKDILDAYQQAMEKSLLYRGKSAFKVEQRATIEGAVSGKIPKETLEKNIIFHDHNQTDCRITRILFFEEEQSKTVYKKQYLLDNEYGFNISHYQNGTSSIITAYSKDRWANTISNLGDTGAAFEGYMVGDVDKPLWKLFKETKEVKLRQDMEEIDGHKTYVLEANIPKRGKYTLWLDPDCDFNLRRCIVHRSGTDLSGGEPLNTPPPPTIDPNPAYPWLPVIEHTLILDSVKIESIEGIFIPVVGNFTFNRKYSNGEEVTVKESYKRYDIDLDPNFDKIESAFVLDAPEGRHVFYMDLKDTGVQYMWQDGKIVPIDIQPVRLLGKPLPELKELGIELQPSDITDKMILVCFFDIGQRPSRNCILQLSKRAQELKAKDIVIVTVQASKVEQAKLDEWVKENNISFTVGIIEGDSEKVRFAWGVRSLPWLILTNKEHIVVAEGFSNNELDEKMKRTN